MAATPDRDPLDKALGRLYQAQQPSPAFEAGWRAAVRNEERKDMKKDNVRRFVMRKVLPAAAAVVLVIGAVSVGSRNRSTTPVPSPSASYYSDDYTYGYSAKEAAPAMLFSASTANDSAPREYADSGAVYEEAVYDSAAGGAAVNGGTQLNNLENRKLVRTADLTIRTKAFEQDLAALQDLLARMGGYVSSLYQSGETAGRRTASLSMNVPSERLDEFLNGMNGIGRVTGRSESASDMTVYYADNEARLATLRTKLQRLNELLAKAENVEDLIELENAIADTQYEIDSYESTQRSIDRQVDMSSVTVRLQEEKSSDTPAVRELTLGERIADGLESSLTWLIGFLKDLLVFIVMMLPAAVVIAVLVLIIRCICKAAKKKKAAKAQAEAPAAEEKNE